MAKALSQEEVLDFLCQGGGKVPNASLLGHFKGFLRDPQVSADQLLKNRERFKRFVNSVAVVKQEAGVKYVVLRSKYRDLLGEDLRPPTPPDPGHQPSHAGGSSGTDRGGTAAEQGGMGPQADEGRSRHSAQLERNGQQPEWEAHSETFGHLQQINLIPLKNHSGSRGITGALNGKAWEASSPKGHLTPDSTPTSSRSPKDISPPPKSISSPNSSSSSYSPHTASVIIKEPSPASRSHRRLPPSAESKTDTANPAFVSATYRDLQEQRQGCMSCSECNQLSVQLKGSLPQEVHFAHEQHSNVCREQPCDSLYQELPVLLSSSRYMHTEHPSPSLLLPHESDSTPPDVLLAECEPVSPVNPSSPLPYNELHGMWMLEMPIFKSIRCQLSLQDLEDFVDQDSCGSDGSDSGEGGDCDTEHRDEEEISSDSNNEKYKHFIEQKSETTRSSPSNTKVLNIIQQYNKQQSEATVGIADKARVQGMTPGVVTDTHKSPYMSFLTDQAPILFELAGNPPRNRIRPHLRENMSSSDDELIDRDYRKRRRPSRSKKLSNIATVAPPPDIDRLLTVKSVTSNSFVVNDQLHFGNQNMSETLHAPKGKMDSDPKKVSIYKSSLVPLDPLEHDWLVKSASGSWLQVYGMFITDPNLALRKDFISGYTVLHWLAKHGCMEMFQKIVTGAKKAGIELNMNVKTSCGYTPLHIAAIHGHYKVATMLVEKLKVNVKLRDNSGKRAWQYLSCTTSGEVWQLLGAPKGKTIFPARALPIAHSINTQTRSTQLNRKTSLAAFLKPQHQKWRANNLPALREREIYSD